MIILILHISSSGLMVLWQNLGKLMGIRLLWFEIIIFDFGLSEISADDKRYLAIHVSALNKSTAVLLRVILYG